MDNYIGEIRMFSFGTVPEGWLSCDGQLVSVNQYRVLFNLLGTDFGGDGRVNFGLPDLRGRVVRGQSATYPRGAIFGTERVALDLESIPKHNHLFSACNEGGDQVVPKNNFLGIAKELGKEHFMYRNMFNPLLIDPASVASSGQGISHNNVQPCLAIRFCIAYTGISPERTQDSHKWEVKGGTDVRI